MPAVMDIVRRDTTKIDLKELAELLRQSTPAPPLEEVDLESLDESDAEFLRTVFPVEDEDNQNR